MTAFKVPLKWSSRSYFTCLKTLCHSKASTSLSVPRTTYRVEVNVIPLKLCLRYDNSRRITCKSLDFHFHTGLKNALRQTFFRQRYTKLVNSLLRVYAGCQNSNEKLENAWDKIYKSEGGGVGGYKSSQVHQEGIQFRRLSQIIPKPFIHSLKSLKPHSYESG